MPITGLFDAISIDFADLLSFEAEVECYQPFAVQHLISWQLIRATVTAITEAVFIFVEEEIIHSFGTLRAILSDNSKHFKAVDVENLMHAWDILWKTISVTSCFH